LCYPINWINDNVPDHYYDTDTRYDLIIIRRRFDNGIAFKYKNNIAGNIKAAAKMKALKNSGNQIKSVMYCFGNRNTRNLIEEKENSYGSSQIQSGTISRQTCYS